MYRAPWVSGLPCVVIAVLVAIAGGTPLLALDELATDETPAYDPFKVLVERPRPPADPILVDTLPPERVKTVQLPPPLNLTVNAIAGGDGAFVAVISYQGADHIVEPGWESDDRKVTVKTVGADRVEVYYALTKALQTFTF